jgi:hypothetical protein
VYILAEQKWWPVAGAEAATASTVSLYTYIYIIYILHEWMLEVKKLEIILYLDRCNIYVYIYKNIYNTIH